MYFSKTKNGDLQKAFEANIVPKWFTVLNRHAEKAIAEDKGLGHTSTYTFGDVACVGIFFFLFSSCFLPLRPLDSPRGPVAVFLPPTRSMFDVVNYITVVTRSSVLRPYPYLKEWHDQTFARPNIHAYLKGRPAADW